MATYDWPDDAAGPEAAKYAKNVLDAIKNGDAEYRWAFIESKWNGHTARIRVLERPIRIDGFYPGAGARLAQQAADLLGALLYTAKVSDLRYKQAGVRIAPVYYDAMVDDRGNALPTFTNPDGSRGAPADMTKVYVMRLYAKYLDAAIKRAGGGGIVGDCGKPWILDNQLAVTPTLAENYGFYVEEAPSQGTVPAMQIFEPGSLPGVKVVQGYWFPPAHGAAQNDSYAGDQADYSETLSGFMHRVLEVDGNKERDIVEVAGDPETAGLVSVNGKPLTVFRQPNVPVYACVSKSAIGARRFVSALGGDLCPMPPTPAVTDSADGSGGGSWGPLMVGAGVAAVGVAAYATRRRWLPAVRRVWRRF